jgi:hypothetical protein
MRESIGIGIITCDRPDFFKKCRGSIKHEWYDHMVVVNDGKGPLFDARAPIIQTTGREGVGRAKNKAFRHLLDEGCEHIFLVEDDVVFKNNAFRAYIEVSKITKVKHFNYCLHGQDNKIDNKPNPRKIIDIRGTKISLYFNVYGACSYYHRSLLEDIGLFDEEYINAMEHVDHTMHAITKKYHPPFRWFIDLENSNHYIEDQDYHHDKSIIRPADGQVENFINGVDRFKNKYKIDVTDPYQEYESLDAVLNYFKSL